MISSVVICSGVQGPWLVRMYLSDVIILLFGLHHHQPIKRGILKVKSHCAVFYGVFYAMPNAWCIYVLPEAWCILCGAWCILCSAWCVLCSAWCMICIVYSKPFSLTSLIFHDFKKH